MPLMQGVCFDLFSTLICVAKVPEHVGRFTADILGIDRRRWHDACFGPEHVIWRPSDPYETLLRLARSIDPHVDAQRVQEAQVERQARFDHALVHIDPAVLNPLRHLKRRGVKLGLISNASSSEVQAWPSSPLAEIFDVVRISCHCGQVKPELPIYHDTLAELALEAEDCLFVGDGGSEEHFGAHAAGMRPVLITHHLEEDEQTRRVAKYQGILHGVVHDVQELYDRYF